MRIHFNVGIWYSRQAPTWTARASRPGEMYIPSSPTSIVLGRLRSRYSPLLLGANLNIPLPMFRTSPTYSSFLNQLLGKSSALSFLTPEFGAGGICHVLLGIDCEQLCHFQPRNGARRRSMSSRKMAASSFCISVVKCADSADNLQYISDNVQFFAARAFQCLNKPFLSQFNAKC